MNELLPEQCALPLSSLRLLVSPLQLMSAALWGIVQHRAVQHYGLLEHFITAVQDNIPGLLTYSERLNIILGLRAKVVLEMCNYDDLCCRQNIEPHLKKMDDLIMEQTDEETRSKMKASFGHFSKAIYSLLDDPLERDMFYQKTLPSEFNLKFDSSLQTLLRQLLLHLENILPVPSLDQTSLWLGFSPSVLKECEDILTQPEPLNDLIHHHQLNSTFSPNTRDYVDDLIFPDLQTESKATQFQSSHTKGEEPQYNVPSVEVTLSFDDDYDEEDYKPAAQCSFSLQQSLSSDLSGKSHRIKTCSKCGQVFTSSVQLTNHMRSHTEEDSHICGERGKDFDHYDKLKFYQENGCKERKDTLMDVKYIQKMHMEQKDFKKCFVLLRRMSPNRAIDFLSENSIQIEKPVIDSDVIKPCNINSLATQINTETDSDPQIIQSEFAISTSTKHSTKCKLCDQTFSELDLMQRHYLNSHMVNGAFQCSACKRAFVRLCDIVRHTQKMRLYPCAKCKRCFTKPSMLKMHKTSYKDTCRIPHISEKKMRHSCNIAHRLKVHKNTQPIMCSYCDKKFCSIYTLKIHMHRHTGGFSCPICPKVFHQKIYLNRHMDRHNGQEPYLCEICGQGWSTQRYLDVHMIKHTDERPFKCDQCEKTFKSVSVLRLHVKSKHSDLRPHVCRVCGKAHKFSGDLKEHMIKHTGVYPHNCSRCGKGFGRLYLLKKHQQTNCK